MTQMVCIVCPKGCHLSVDEENGCAVTGAGCEKGIEYGKTELTDPRRTVTSTVVIKGARLCRLPVKTSSPVPKKDIFRVMEEIDKVTVQAPIKIGDRVIENVCETGIDVVATRQMEGIG
ncbi:MAG: DUF1667 domain-containing protein [Oscillospiraceae bacterium]